MFEEEGQMATHAAHSLRDPGVQAGKLVGATVGQPLSFDISPQGLHRIQVRRVAGQLFHGQPTPLTT